MADPELKTLTADTWTKVATNVTAAAIYKKSSGKYWFDYIATGSAAPTDFTTAIQLLDYSFSWSGKVAADLYVLKESTDGSVVVHQ